MPKLQNQFTVRFAPAPSDRLRELQATYRGGEGEPHFSIANTIRRAVEEAHARRCADAGEKEGEA